MPPQTGSALEKIGFVLVRVVVPLWVLTGAVFKLVERTPANLPSQIWRTADRLGIDLHILLATLISVEFLIVAVLVFLPRLARAAAIFMLSVFCLVLLNEMRTGNFESCGCLGNIPVKPWQMLAMDATLLAGVIALGSRGARTAGQPRWAPAAAAVLALGGAALSFGLIMPERRPIDQTASNGKPVRSSDPPTTGTDLPADPRRNPSVMPLPAYLTADGISDWIGRPWRELDLFKVLPQWPSGMDDPIKYVVLYSRSCEHCEAMFYDQLIIPLDGSVTAIEIPSSKTVMTAPDAWAMPAAPVELMSLPMECTWMITPPLVVKLQDGTVVCALEGEGSEQCLAQ